MKSLIPALLCCFLAGEPLVAQTKLFSKNVIISFFSKAPLENITAKNTSALCVWNTANDSMEISVLMKGFEFEKALMQEHFNENYVESDRFPKATFRGRAENSKNFLLTSDDDRNIQVKGELTIHGITQKVSVLANIKVINGVISSSADFNILLSDYNIKIPSIVTGHISKEILITVTVPVFRVFKAN